jgi:hypothetical protein
MLSLRRRTHYFGGGALYYTPKMSLSRHTDGVGGWLVLFSFGLTVNFFVGQKTVLFESGDALIFVSATVQHGVDDTLDHATLRDQRHHLPPAVQKVVGRQRMSLLARQHQGGLFWCLWTPGRWRR